MMLAQRFFLLLLLYICTFKISAQTTYEVGMSSVSLEPDKCVFSVALAGYGYPPEGRFSIEWVKKGPAVGIKALTGINSMLYALDINGTLLTCDVTRDEIQWKHVQSATDFLYLAGMNDDLYAISSTGNLLKGQVKSNAIIWNSIAQISNVVAFAAADGNLFVATADGNLQKGVQINDNQVQWQLLGKIDDVLALTAEKGRLYYVSHEGLLWQRNNIESDTEWIKIGYPNSVSYVEPLRQIAIADGRLYGVNDCNELLVAHHNTLGDLSACALAISHQGKTVILVGVDLTGFDYSLSRDVKRDIEMLYGIPPEAVLINASHSHFSPVTQWFPTWGKHHQFPDSLYLNSVVKKGIVESVGKALKNRKNATLRFVRGNTQIGMNRSLYGNEALVDADVDVLQIDAKKGCDELLFLASCHPVFKNEGKAAYTLSPNFPGIARWRLEEMLNLSGAMFLQGCAGDVNPVEADPVKTGVCLADDVMKALEKGNKEILQGEIKYEMDSVLFPANVWNKEQIERFRAENSLYPNDVEAAKNVRWADMMLNYYATNTVPQYLPVYIQILHIGQWKIIGLSREAVSEYSFSIKQLWPDSIVSVLGYTNDVSSYLPNAVHIERGTYEGYGSFFWNAQPAFFPKDVLNVILKKINCMIDYD